MVNSSIAANFKIIANGKDITASIQPNLISLRITDNEKDEADSLEMQINAKFKRPDFGDELKVYLGRGNESTFVGLFFMQSSTITNNKQMTIQATGVDFSKGLKERRNQAYLLSLDQVAAYIANIHGLSLKTDVQEGFMFEQKHESDMAFLNRLAKEYNAVFNIKNNTLYMMKEAVDVPKINIDINRCIRSEITQKNTTFYQSCKAVYHDTKLNQKVEVVIGSGEPVHTIQGKWLTKEQAQDAAKHALQRANQGTVEGSISIIGRVVFAGSELSLDNQKYSITQVTHSVGKNWITDIQFKHLK